MTHILAVDIGSSFLKCALYTADLRLLAHVVRGFELRVDGPCVEADPEDWWRAMREAVPALLADAGVARDAVSALVFCAQMQSVVLVDRALNPVRRSIGFLDTRATAVFAEQMQRGWLKVEGVNAWKLAASAWSTNIAPGSPKDTIWKIRWLEEHEPRTLARAYRWLDVKDYLVARCAGRAVTTPDSAHLTCLYDFAGEGSAWNVALCRRYGIDPGLLPEVVPGNRGVGGLLPEAALELGLAPGTTVVPGGGDISCVMLGTGAIAEGDTHVYLGTSAWVGQCTRRRKLDISNYMASLRTALPNDHLYLGELETAGLCLQWAAKLLGGPGAVIDDFSGLEAEAHRSPVGAKGLLFSPWLHGSRSPNEDPFARAGFFNLGLVHARSDMIRAVFEGVALHLGWILQALETKMPAPGSLRFVGGGANSALWAQCLADVTGRPVAVVEDPQLCGARGAALLAVSATQPASDIRLLAARIQAGRPIQPVPANVGLYRERLVLLKRVYAANRPLFRSLPRA